MSRHPLVVIIPLAAVFLLLLVTVVALCVWLLSRKEDKPKPLTQPKTNLKSPSTGSRAERSGAIPTVTVTPLIRSSLAPSLFQTQSYDRPAPLGAEPVEKCAPWDAWVNLDPDMAKLCRQTNPALKHNQYWV